MHRYSLGVLVCDSLMVALWRLWGVLLLVTQRPPWDLFPCDHSGPHPQCTPYWLVSFLCLTVWFPYSRLLGASLMDYCLSHPHIQLTWEEQKLGEVRLVCDHFKHKT